MSNNGFIITYYSHPLLGDDPPARGRPARSQSRAPAPRPDLRKRSWLLLLLQRASAPLSGPRWRRSGPKRRGAGERLRVAAQRNLHWHWQRVDFSIGMQPLRTGVVKRSARWHLGWVSCTLPPIMHPIF